jgi:hypothetical protein
MIYKNSVRTSQETHDSATKPKRIMLFRETVAVYRENHTEHRGTLCGQNAVYINSVRTSQETQYASVTKPNRLCENHMKKISCVGRMQGFTMLKQVLHKVTTGL